MSNNTPNASESTPSTVSTSSVTAAITTTVLSTGPTSTVTLADGIAPGGIAGIVIGAIVISGLFVALIVVFVIRRKVKDKKGSDKYIETIKNLKINQLPSPSEVESAEIRPLDRNPTKKPEIEPDLSSSDKHYQNVSELKYENIEGSELGQPIYLEPKPEEKRLYSTTEGSEYYVVDDPSKQGKTPGLPSREDNAKPKKVTNVIKTQKDQAKKEQKSKPPKPKPNKAKSQPVTEKPKQSEHKKEESSSDSDSDSESNKPGIQSKKDYVNLQDEKITPPAHVVQKHKTQSKQELIVDDVYENEELPKSPRTKSKT